METNAIRKAETNVKIFEETTSPKLKSCFCTSCNSKFSPENLLYHEKFKLRNFNAQFIHRSELKESDIFLCPDLNCCYATKSDSQLKNHYENFSNHKASTVNTNVVLIMSRTITAAKEAELNQCSRCSKRFVSSKNLSRHMAHCRGRGFLSCDLCGETSIKTYEEFFSHLSSNHETKHFVELNKFIGASTLTNKKYKTSNYKSKEYLKIQSKKIARLKKQNALIEYFHIPTSIKINDTDIFTDSLTEELHQIVLRDLLGSGSGVLVSMYSEVIVERLEGESVNYKLQQQIGRYKVQLENLHSLEGSGIRISHIKNLRVQVGGVAFVKSGCVDVRIENSLSRAETRGLTLIVAKDQNCLVHAVSCSIHFEDEKKINLKNIVNRCSQDCTLSKHCKQCLKNHQKSFNAEQRKPETWAKYNIQLEDINTPSSLTDVFAIERVKPTYKFHIFEVCGDFYRKIYATNISNCDVSHNVFLLRMQIITDSGDLASHWAPITDINKFLARMYYGASDRCSFSKTTACPYCLQIFFPNAQTATMSEIGEEIKKNNETNMSYITHLEHCRCDSLSKISFPDEKNLSFHKFKALSEPKLSFYADIETTHTKVEGKLCNICFLAYNECLNEEKRGQILKFCLTANHSQLRVTDCNTCFKEYLKIASQLKKGCSAQNHVKIQYEPLSNLQGDARCLMDYILCIACNTSAVKQSLCSCENSCGEKCNTRNVCEHRAVRTISSLRPISIGLIGVQNYPDFDAEYKVSTTEVRKSPPAREIFIDKLFLGDDCVSQFYSYLKRNTDSFMNIQNPSEITPAFRADDEEALFKQQKQCGYCGVTFSSESLKVFDHSHQTGRFRTASCQSCNLNVQEESSINIYFHNLENFDSHILLSNYSELQEDEISEGEKFKFSVIPTNSEKVKGFTFGNYRFKDSLLFLKSSLDENVELARKSAESKGLRMPLIEKHSLCFKDGEFSEFRYGLLTRKGCLPYEQITSYESLFKEGFPSFENFYSQLKSKNIDKEVYNHTKMLWNEFDCQTLLDLLKIYQTSDALLLADVFSGFKDCCFNAFNLYPDSFFTLPSFSYNAWLYTVKNEKIQHIKNTDMRAFLQRSMRGGLCSTGFSRIAFSTGIKKHLKSLRKKFENMRYRRMPDKFDKKESSSESTNKLSDTIWKQIEKALDNGDQDTAFKTYIYYLDANNLYGAAQTMKLPKNNFKWTSVEETAFLEAFYKKKSLTRDSSKIEDYSLFETGTGFFIECDLEYPAELHDLHSDLPLAPSKVEVTRADLSKSQTKLLNNFNTADNYKSTKLIASLHDKKNYTVHYSLLNLYIELGMKLTKIYRVLSFHESEYMNDWVQRCTRGRQEAVKENNFLKKAFYKLVVNSVFGKTIERQETQRSFELISSSEDALKMNENPRLIKRTLISPSLIMYELVKKKIVLDKPIFIGLSVLERSKEIMYSYLYKVLKPVYGSRVNILYSDTDSLVINLRSKNIEADMANIADTLCSKSRLFKFKDECFPKRVVGWVAIRAKQYSLLLEEYNAEVKSYSLKVQKIGKGVPSNVLSEMDFLQYLDTCINSTDYIGTTVKFQSSNHRLAMVENSRVSLRNFDDKRFMLSCLNHTRPYGHYLNTSSICNMCSF